MIGWVRDGLSVLSTLAGPIQHFWSAVLEGWRSKVSADLCAKGFRGGPWLDVDGTLRVAAELSLMSPLLVRVVFLVAAVICGQIGGGSFG